MRAQPRSQPAAPPGFLPRAAQARAAPSPAAALLRSAFCSYGRVKQARIVRNPTNGESRGELPS